MIVINNITKRFSLPKSLGETVFSPFKQHKKILAVDNVSLALDKGEILALLGPNGAGKTTLIKILCTLLLPDKGSAKICGYDLLAQADKVKNKIGFVSGEERGFYWRLSGRQNLEFFGVLYNLSDSRIKENISRLAEFLEIDDIDKPYQLYSTGMKHRIALARCLMGEPDIIFMDEPTKSLDPKSAHKFRSFIKEKLVSKLDKTVFFATHDTAEAQMIADKIAILDHGKIKAFGKLDEIRAKSRLKKSATLEDYYLKIMAAGNET